MGAYCTTRGERWSQLDVPFKMRFLRQHQVTLGNVVRRGTEGARVTSRRPFAALTA